MTIVPRSEWGARPPKKAPPRLSTELVTIHWEGPSMGSFPHSKCAGKVRGIQDFHMDTRGWNDIAYSGVVCPHGYVFEGRGRGARTGANGTNEGNASAYALCALIGVGDKITDALLDGLADGVAWLRGKQVNAHRDWKPTECPGDALTAYVRAGRFTPTGSVAPPAPPARTTLRQGDEGDDVKFMQAMLNIVTPELRRQGFGDGKPLAEDGRFGARTAARVLEFERYWNKKGPGRSKPLMQDGVFTEGTASALAAIVTLVLDNKKGARRGDQ